MAEQYPLWYHQDNGFTSRSAMDRAHGVLLEMVEYIPHNTLNRVIDFGCGNGVLLRKIISRHQCCVPFGVDLVPARIARARGIHGEHAVNFEACSMFDRSARWLVQKNPYSLGIFMIGRLLEVTKGPRTEFLGAIAARCEHLLTYFYGGWSEAEADLSTLAQRCDILLYDRHSGGTAAFVGFPSTGVGHSRGLADVNR